MPACSTQQCEYEASMKPRDTWCVEGIRLIGGTTDIWYNAGDNLFKEDDNGYWKSVHVRFRG